MKKLNEISNKLMQSYRTGAKARVKKLEADFKGGDRSMARATEIRKRDRNIITVGNKLVKRELAANTKAHTDANAGPKKPVARDSGSASDYYKFKKPGQYVGDSVEIEHDGNQIDELSKTTLGSYVKKASSDSSINRKIATDFEHRAKRAKKADMKDSNDRLAVSFRSKSWQRQAGVDKAVDRLTKEDVTIAERDEKFTAKEIKMAVGVAKDKRYAGGNMTGAAKVMDKIKKGLSNHPVAQKALQQANEAKDPREYDYEGDMAKSQLRSIIANAQTIHDMLKDDTNMAEWVQSKITLSADYISTVRDYITSETNEETNMKPIHPDALHVKPVTVNGQTKYKVHAVGSNFSDGIKKGEHLSDTELDDFSEMGGKVKHIKESTLSSILDEARGRPRKNPVAALTKKSDSEDHEDDEGPVHADASGDGGDTHIQNQLKRAHDAHDLKGGADVKFGNGKTHFIKSEHAHKVLTALEKIPKPSDRADAAAHVYGSHDNFKTVHSMLK